MKAGNWGSTAQHVQDSLRYFDWPGKISAMVPENHFDVILTNPPFAGDLDLTNIWDYFDLAKKNGEELGEQKKDILFLERCIKHLAPGGRLAIVKNTREQLCV